MYEEFFGLTAAPFKLNPDPKFFFGSRSHNKAMAYLHYGLKQAEGFIVITGPVGAGKSMLIGHLLDQLNSSNIIAAHLLTSNVAPHELLSHVLSAFRIAPENEGRAGELEAFEDFLFDQLNHGRRVLLILDEAQNLPRDTLEELRMLSNIDYDGTPLFQVFLVGQPEFRATMDAQNMEQLKQRVIASYHLEELNLDETREYIEHRLGVVGWTGNPSFTDEALELIHKETSGRPRRINTLCARLLLYCALEKSTSVNGDVVRTVLAELAEEKLTGPQDESAATPVAQPKATAPSLDKTPPKDEKPVSVPSPKTEPKTEPNTEPKDAPNTGAAPQKAKTASPAPIIGRESKDDKAHRLEAEKALIAKADQKLEPLTAPQPKSETKKNAEEKIHTRAQCGRKNVSFWRQETRAHQSARALIAECARSLKGQGGRPRNRRGGPSARAS